MIYCIYMNSRKASSIQGGFTLIELLVVIAIIGVLASVILASLNTARGKGRDAFRKQSLTELRTALELYYDDHNAYPILDAYSPWNETTWGINGNTTFYNDIVPKYMSSLPQDPSKSFESAPANYLGDGYPADRGFFYRSTDGQHFILGTNLENGAPANFAGSYQIITH